MSVYLSSVCTVYFGFLNIFFTHLRKGEFEQPDIPGKNAGKTGESSTQHSSSKRYEVKRGGIH